LVLLVTLGCGMWVGNPKKPDKGGGTTAPKNVVTITGQLVQGSGLTASATADTVLALPLAEGKARYDAEAFAPVALEADGRFSIDLPMTSDWVVAFAALREPPLPADAGPVETLARVAAFLAFPAGDSRELVQIPATAGLGPVDAGVVTLIPGSDLARASRTVDELTASFATPPEKLRELAATGDVLRLAKNAIANRIYTAEVQARFQSPSYDERYQQGSPVPLLSTDAFTDPAATGFVGYSIGFYTTDPAFDVGRLCAGADDASFLALAVTPPAAIDVTDGPERGRGSWGPSAPFTNAATTGSAESCDATQLHVDTGIDGERRFGVGATERGLPAPVPSGVWTVQLGDATVAAFDFGPVNLVDAAGRPRIYVPSFRYALNADGHVGSIEAKLHYWSPEAGAFLPVQDLAALAETVTEVSVAVVQVAGESNASVPVTESLPVTVAGDTFAANGLSKKWAPFGATKGEDELTTGGIRLNYVMHGVRMYFAIY
jgi:hypothetical protein